VLAGRDGLSLVWVLGVILVITLVLGTAFLVTNGRTGALAASHGRQQAYHTALSSLETVSQWISTGSAPGAPHQQEAEALLDEIRLHANAGGLTCRLEGLAGTMGQCSIHFGYLDKTGAELTLTATATYAAATEVLSLTMREGEPVPVVGSLPVSTYDGTRYDARAAEVDALASDGIVPLYDDSAADNSQKNQDDLALLGKEIPDAGSTKEARWTNVNLKGTGRFDQEVLGTQRYPRNGRNDTATDNRRFMVPVNGRIMIDPLEGGASLSESATASKNTKLAALAIDNTAGKDVLFRLASDSEATGGGTYRMRSEKCLNSLIMLDFTDNANRSESFDYQLDGQQRSHTWHPDNWKTLDLYVQSGAKVTSNLVFGPFGHKYDDYLDYWSWGNFVDNWNGTTEREYVSLWPYTSSPSSNGGNYRGLPIFPVTFGRDASFWILDRRADRSFRLMQGVDVIEGTVYSTRPTVIGGGILRSNTSGKTTDGINSDRSGYSHGSSSSHNLYADATVRYDQLIYDTDIVLKAPASGTARSVVRRPDTWEDKTVSYHSFDQGFNPTMTIKGGTVFVGAGQALTVQGATRDNMWISPERIVVETGGSLTIQPSAHTNVLTDVYVDGGVLEIEAGAKLKGNIYAYNGGEVRIGGGFTLDSPHDDLDASVLTADEAKDGIHIYGKGLVDVADGILSPGVLVLPKAFDAGALVIGGSANRVHLHGVHDGSLVHAPDGSSFGQAMRERVQSEVLCRGSDPKTGICTHYGLIGAWQAGKYARG
ncbi:MAG: hypothetical protein LBL86_03425, partial [Coriobacteriales bacterium]|nr:hypothetical protein [Coriobacteriales bacterium]